MVVGFDAHHAGGTSVGAMVATLNQTLSRYYSRILTVAGRGAQEVGTTMGSALIGTRVFSRLNAITALLLLHNKL